MKNRNRILHVERILRLFTDENHSLTGREIAELIEEQYGISAYRSTVADDIAALIEAGMDIEIERSVQNRYRFVGRDFDKAELKMMIDAVNASKFITKTKSKDLVKKISSLAGPGSEQLNRHAEVENRAKNGNTKLFLIIDTIHEAINRNRQISFIYFKYNERKEKVRQHSGKPYLFNPFFLVWNGEYYYMVGSYANHPETVAAFRIDRILERPEILNQKCAAPPKIFRAEKYLNDRIHMFGSADQESSRVELLCDNATANGIIDRFGLDVEMTPADAEHFLAVVHVVPTSVFYGWVFGFGGKVRIVGPEEVVQEYYDMIEVCRAKRKASEEVLCAPCAVEQVDDVDNSYLNS